MINVTYTATAFSIFYMHRILLEATHALLLTASGSASRMRISWGGRGVWRERGGGGWFILTGGHNRTFLLSTCQMLSSTKLPD